MNKTRVWSIALPAILLIAAVAAEVSETSKIDAPTVTIRKLGSQTVLYTIYRGSYDKIGPAVGKLYGLAGKNRIIPRGSASYVYLNNPRRVSSEHWLTEIRIPVGKDALKLAGTLGEMTDVKQLPAMQVAVAVKPEGQADPAPVYDSLYSWIYKQGYMVVDSACEVFLSGAMTGNYAQMKSEIMVPIRKFSSDKD